MKRASRGIAHFLIGVLAIIFIAVVIVNMNTSTEITYSDLMTNITQEKVEKLILSSDGDRATVEIKDEKGQKIVYIPSLTAFMNSVEENVKDGSLKIVKEESHAALLDYITPISLVILLPQGLA